MKTSLSSPQVRRTFVVVALFAALWSVAAALSGGLSLSFGPLRLSSRNPRNPTILALLSIAIAWALAPSGGRARTVAADWGWLVSTVQAMTRRGWTSLVQAEENGVAPVNRWLAPLLAAVTALTIVIVGLTKGALVAGASDAYGYVSHAHLWATGTLRVEQPLMRELAMEIPRQALAPLAYRPSPEGMTIVPVTAPGLPMLMAVFERVAGPDAVFYVVPLLAGVAVWASYLLGRRFVGPWTGVLTAVFLAASPSFLFQLTHAPMSDIPATAWWALSLALVLADGSPAAFGAGLTAGVAILTRPNLVPLGVVPGALLVWQAMGAKSDRAKGAQHVLLYAAGAIPACIAIGILNSYLYGSPLESGYGALENIYRWEYFRPNLERYPRWLIESQTPVVVVAVVTPLLLWRHARRGGATRGPLVESVFLLAFAVSVFGCYMFYEPFDAWWFLRFVLPAFPPLLALMSAGIVFGTRRVAPGWRTVVGASVVILVTSQTFAYAKAAAALDSAGEWKYAVAGRYVAEHLPERAVLLAVEHSGSIRYYSGRVTIRFNWIPSSKLTWVLHEVRRLGYHTYVLVEDWEEPEFRQRFQGDGAVSLLDRPPVGLLPLGNVRIYDGID